MQVYSFVLYISYNLKKKKKKKNPGTLHFIFLLQNRIKSLVYILFIVLRVNFVGLFQQTNSLVLCHLSLGI